MSRFEDPLRQPAGLFAGFLAATVFFTRLPVDARAAGEWRLADSAWAFPLVGAGIGGAAALALLVAQLIGLASWPAALLSVLGGIALTGALHEDGLADTADGLGGGTTRERALDIMRDGRIGAYGTCALVICLALRIGAVSDLPRAALVAWALVGAHAMARAVLPAFMCLVPPARADGLSATAGANSPLWMQTFLMPALAILA